jgi:hypothetical protein
VLDETNLENISIHHSKNLPKGITIAVQRCSVWCQFLRLEFILKKTQTNRKKDEFHPKENPYTQYAQPPIFSYRNINSVRHHYNGWEAITFIIFENIL